MLLFVSILHPRIGWGAELRDEPLHPMRLSSRIDSLPRSIVVKDGRNLRFRRLPRSSGLSQTRVATVTQDALGFMWFGTQYGLNRFDGYKSKVFKHELQRPNSLSCVYIRALLVDHAGRLWVGCDRYLDRYEPATETFIHFPVDPNSTEAVSRTLRIDEDHAGTLWISTTRGLYKFDPKNSRMTRYIHSPADRFSLSANLIYRAQEDQKGRFWVASSGGLDQFDRIEGKVKQHAPVQMSVGWFHQDRFGVFWMTGDDLSCTLASWDQTDTKVKCHSIQYKMDRGTEKISIGQIIEDADGTLWLTSSHGLLKLSPNRQDLIRYHNNPLDLESLESDEMVFIFRDREGNIWTCFQVNEPNYFESTPQSFVNFTSRRGELVDPLVTSIYQDRQGILWIGSMGGLNRIDRRTGKNIVPPGSGVRNEILSILEDRSGTLFAGTFHRGLQRIDHSSGLMSAYLKSGKSSNLAKNPIMRLIYDHAGNLWAAAYGGISRLDEQTGNFLTFTPGTQDQIEYQAITEDADRTMWLGGQTGLHHFDPKTNRFTIFQHSPDNPSSLSDNRVNSIHIDSSGTMWVGTQNGLDKYDRKRGTFSTYTETDGLAGNVVSCILENAQGVLWMSTNNGITKLDRVNHKFENYSIADGLPGQDLSGWGACYQSSDGEMFFGGFSGATAFHPDRIARDKRVPNVVLTDFHFSGTSIQQAQRSPFPNSITFTKSVNLTHSQRDFSIEFSALSFFDPETNRYRYRLVGHDSRWNEVGSDQRIATYTTLPVGSYTFEVEGSTSHGRWSAPAVLGIEVLPAWYQTQAFRALGVLVLIGLSWFTYVLRIRNLERRFGVLMEVRLAERTRIARALHDTLLQSLHGLMYRSQAARNMLPQRPQEAMKVLDGAIIRTEQAIAESRDAIKDLRTARSGRYEIADALTAMGQELADSREDGRTSPVFSVTVEGQPLPLSSIIQDEACQIAQEILANAFRHAEAHRIESEIRYDRHCLRLRFRDDGKGIDPEILKVGGRPGHWGLPGIRERAHRIGAKLDFWSEAGAGAEIQLSIPGALAYKEDGKNARVAPIS